MCTNLAFIPLVFFCYPETSNLTLEEIYYLFTEDGPPAVKASIEWAKRRRRGDDIGMMQGDSNEKVRGQQEWQEQVL